MSMYEDASLESLDEMFLPELRDFFSTPSESILGALHSLPDSENSETELYDVPRIMVERSPTPEPEPLSINTELDHFAFPYYSPDANDTTNLSPLTFFEEHRPFLTGNDESPASSIHSFDSPDGGLSPIPSLSPQVHSPGLYQSYSPSSDSSTDNLALGLAIISVDSPYTQDSSPDILSGSPSFLSLPVATLHDPAGLDSPCYNSSPEMFSRSILFEPVNNGAGGFLLQNPFTNRSAEGTIISRRRARSVGGLSVSAQVVRSQVGTDRMTEVGRSRRLRSNSTGKYICEHCMKTFTSKDNWEYHYNSHMGLAPYKCRYCDKAFKGKGDKYRHEKKSCPIERRSQEPSATIG